MEEQSDRYQIIIAIMIAVVSLAGAVVAWQATLIEDDDADKAGLAAALNAETTHFINEAVLAKHHRAYTTYSLNDELQNQIQAGITDANSAEQNQRTRQLTEASNLAGTSRLFFPSRYLNRDGTYNTQRELGEAWAQAGQINDLEAQPHFDEADSLRVKALFTITILLLLTVSLLFYTIAEGLHPERRSLRLYTAIGGTAFLVISIVGAVIVENVF